MFTSGQSRRVVRDGVVTGFTSQLKAQGTSDEDIERVKIWWSEYSVEPTNDEGTIARTRKVIQNDDHDPQ